MNSLNRTLLLASALIAASIAIAHADPVSRAQRYLAHEKPRDAMLVLRNDLRHHPDNGPANLLLARLDLELGSPVSAEREAKAARKAQYRPNHALTLILDSYIAQSRYIDLLHDFPLGTATGETGARIALGREEADLALHRAGHAAADLNQAENFDPKLPAVWLARAAAALGRGDKAGAAQDLAKAKALDPSDPKVVLADARASLAAGKPQKAIAALHGLLAKHPSDIDARLTLASALIATAQPKPAQAQITTVLKLAPGSIGAMYLQAGLDVSNQKWPAAQAILQHLSPIMPHLPGAYFLQAETLLHLGETGAAQQAAAHYVARVPGDPAGHRLLAALALQDHHPHLALSTIKAAGPAGRQDFGMTMLQGSAEQSIGHAAVARSAFTRAATMAPASPAPFVHLGQLDGAAGDMKAATAAFQKAATLAPTDPGLQATLAQAAIAADERPVARAAIDRLDRLKGPATGALLAAELDLADFRLDAAKADYQASLKAQPHNTAAMLGIAHIDLLQGDQAAAESMTARAVKADPTNQAAVSALASLLASTQNFAKTDAVLQAAHRASPDNAVFVADLASLDIRLKKLDQANTLLAGVPAKLANNPLILTAKAQVALAGHDTAGAKADLAGLIAHDPQYTGARIALARLDAGSGDLAGAKTALDDGLKVSPHNATLMQAEVGLALKRGGLKAAVATADALAGDAAHQPESLLLPGKLYMAEDRPHQAVAAFDKTYQATPSPALALNLAQAQAVAGDKASARTTLAGAIKSFGPLPSLENAAGQIALASNDLPAASAHYQRALAKAPDDVLALNNLAWIAGKQHDKSAAGLAARAYAISPTPQVADTLGWILARRSDPAPNPSQALVLLAQAHQGMPGDPDVSFHYASVLAQTGHKAKAAAILKPVLANKGTFTDRAAAEKLDASLGKT